MIKRTCEKCRTADITDLNPEYDFCDECINKFIASNPKDYQLICNIDTPKHIRRKFFILDVYNNSIQCNKCKQIIRSKNRHNYVTCKCGNCSVDGGSHYCRVMGSDWTSLSQAFSDVDDFNVFTENVDGKYSK